MVELRNEFDQKTISRKCLSLIGLLLLQVPLFKSLLFLFKMEDSEHVASTQLLPTRSRFICMDIGIGVKAQGYVPLHFYNLLSTVYCHIAAYIHAGICFLRFPVAPNSLKASYVSSYLVMGSPGMKLKEVWG